MAAKPKPAKPADPFDPEALRITPELVVKDKPAGSQPHRRPIERYVQITETGARGFETLGCSAALVWFEILYRVWKTGRTTIELPNKRLADMGVSRWAKSRAISRLERAGWIRVGRTPRKTPQITLLKPECVVFRRKWMPPD